MPSETLFPQRRKHFLLLRRQNINLVITAVQPQGDGDEGDEGIEEAFVDPGFEGEFQVVLGTDSQTYRVFTLSDPTRLVIDIAHD